MKNNVIKRNGFALLLSFLTKEDRSTHVTLEVCRGGRLHLILLVAVVARGEEVADEQNGDIVFN